MLQSQGEHLSCIIADGERTMEPATSLTYTSYTHLEIVRIRQLPSDNKFSGSRVEGPTISGHKITQSVFTSKEKISGLHYGSRQFYLTDDNRTLFILFITIFLVRINRSIHLIIIFYFRIGLKALQSSTT